MEEYSDGLNNHHYAYLTTVGRVTGRPHRIEIWFVMISRSMWVLSGGGRNSDWVQNLIADPELVVEVGDGRWTAQAVLHDEAASHPARERLAERYQGWQQGTPLTEWALSSLLISITTQPSTEIE